MNHNSIPNVPAAELHTFRNLNLQKADFEKINTDLDAVNWTELSSECTSEEFAELFRLTVLQICEKHCPVKNVSDQRKKGNPRRSALVRRKKKLNARIKSIKNTRSDSPTIAILQKEIDIIHNQIKESIIQQKNLEEEKAVNAILENPKYFYSYSKKSGRCKCRVGPLFDKQGTLQKDPKMMADLLQDQYAAVFSNPQNKSKNSYYRDGWENELSRQR